MIAFSIIIYIYKLLLMWVLIDSIQIRIFSICILILFGCKGVHRNYLGEEVGDRIFFTNIKNYQGVALLL